MSSHEVYLDAHQVAHLRNLQLFAEFSQVKVVQIFPKDSMLTRFPHYRITYCYQNFIVVFINYSHQLPDMK
jgi:hypothetical protein